MAEGLGFLLRRGGINTGLPKPNPKHWAKQENWFQSQWIVYKRLQPLDAEAVPFQFKAKHGERGVGRGGDRVRVVLKVAK